MSRFLRTLVKVGLVELDPEEHERMAKATTPAAAAKEADEVEVLLKETEAMLAASSGPKASAPPPPPPAAAARPSASPRSSAAPSWTPPTPRAAPAASADGSSGITEGRSFPEIYADANIPASPFPAEKLLRLIDGLKAMDSAMRIAAITAMDAADDAWTIDDPLQDAQRKIATLSAAKVQLGTIVGQAEARAESEAKAADQYQKEATDKIRAQIAELEALLEQELQSVATQKAESHGRLEATREAAAREGARLSVEIDALSGILDAFKR